MLLRIVLSYLMLLTALFNAVSLYNDCLLFFILPSVFALLLFIEMSFVALLRLWVIDA